MHQSAAMPQRLENDVISPGSPVPCFCPVLPDLRGLPDRHDGDGVTPELLDAHHQPRGGAGRSGVDGAGRPSEVVRLAVADATVGAGAAEIAIVVSGRPHEDGLLLPIGLGQRLDRRVHRGPHGRRVVVVVDHSVEPDAQVQEVQVPRERLPEDRPEGLVFFRQPGQGDRLDRRARRRRVGEGDREHPESGPGSDAGVHRSVCRRRPARDDAGDGGSVRDLLAGLVRGAFKERLGDLAGRHRLVERGWPRSMPESINPTVTPLPGLSSPFATSRWAQASGTLTASRSQLGRRSNSGVERISSAALATSVLYVSGLTQPSTVEMPQGGGRSRRHRRTPPRGCRLRRRAAPRRGTSGEEPTPGIREKGSSSGQSFRRHRGCAREWPRRTPG